MIDRKKTKVISLGDIKIGGNEPIRVQSMTKTDTKNVRATLSQIRELVDAGCEIVRVAVKDHDSLDSLKQIVRKAESPIVADIHFNYRLALGAISAGVKGLRINPGNIGSEEKIKEVVACAKDNCVPIRVGVNAGSLEKHLETKYGGPTPQALVESALHHVGLIEKYGYDQIKISIKASDVSTVVKGYRLLSHRLDYPLHLGVTEAGTMQAGSVKSSVALGILLSQGIGDTIRVSLTESPLEEVKVAYMILNSLKLREPMDIEIISCPTCGRCEWNLTEMVNEVEAKLVGINLPLKIAIMGCGVNGPGEAKQADIGIAGGKNCVAIFVLIAPYRYVE